MTITTKDPAAVVRERGLKAYAVTPALILAGQPQPEDWPYLVADEFECVINVRSDTERGTVEQRNAETCGLRYLHLPLRVYELEPADLAAFHGAMASMQGKVMLHCRSANRVALLWMLDRMVYDGWTMAQAEEHLRAAGYSDESIESLSFCATDYFERVE